MVCTTHYLWGSWHLLQGEECMTAVKLLLAAAKRGLTVAWRRGNCAGRRTVPTTAYTCYLVDES